MRRTLGSIGAWLVATSIAILVAWLGVRSVQFAAVPDRIEPMSAAEARRLAPRSPEPAASPSTSVSRSPSSSPSPSKSPSTGPTTANGEWQQVPDGQGGTALQRTFQVKGGAATIRFSEGNIRVMATAPASGYAVSFEQRVPDVAVVIFTSPSHISRIEAAWQGEAKVKFTESDG
jgi:hypothetical protein